MSKKITELRTVTALATNDLITGVDVSEPSDSLKNIQITKANLQTGLALDADLTAHEATNAGSAHPDGTTATDLANHKSGANEHPQSSITGLQTDLAGKQPNAPAGNQLGVNGGWTAAGNSATRNVGTLNTDVAAGDAPAGAVTGHESTYDHANLPTAAEKAALAGAPTAITGANPVYSEADIQASLADKIEEGSENITTGLLKMSVVNTLPGTPDADTVYFVLT